jgi:hypothetical protein
METEKTPKKDFDSIKENVDFWINKIVEKLDKGPAHEITWETVETIQEVSDRLLDISKMLKNRWRD